jgi:hypothetical protein
MKVPNLILQNEERKKAKSDQDPEKNIQKIKNTRIKAISKAVNTRKTEIRIKIRKSSKKEKSIKIKTKTKTKIKIKIGRKIKIKKVKSRKSVEDILGYINKVLINYN